LEWGNTGGICDFTAGFNFTVEANVVGGADHVKVQFLNGSNTGLKYVYLDRP